MGFVILSAFNEFAKGISFAFPQNPAIQAASFAMNPNVLIAGVILIVVSVVIFTFLKKIMEHAVMGVIAWTLTIFVFKIQLPLMPSLVVSVILGPAGIGVMLILKFFGLF